jgi:hypothetical protein
MTGLSTLVKTGLKRISKKPVERTRFETFNPTDKPRINPTQIEEGLIDPKELKTIKGEMGEIRGEHRNIKGKDWELFKEDIKQRGVINPIHLNVDPGKGVRVSEGNHRLDAALEVGLEKIPFTRSSFGKAEKEYLNPDGTIKRKSNVDKQLDNIEEVNENLDPLTALNRTKQDVDIWKAETKVENQLSKEAKKEQEKLKTALQKNAKDLYEGKISREQFLETRDKLAPTKVYASAPEPYTPFEVLASLKENQALKYGLTGVNKNLKQGEPVTTRFDINAYQDYGVYVATITKKIYNAIKKKAVNSVHSYSPTAYLKDASFDFYPDTAFGIARGKTKTPFATIKGKWQNKTPQSIKQLADSIIGSEEWTEVGFNPAVRTSFYNRLTGEPVFNADEIIQIGPMILAKNVKKPTKEQLEKFKIKIASGEKIQAFNKGGMVMRSDNYNTQRAI